MWLWLSGGEYFTGLSSGTFWDAYGDTHIPTPILGDGDMEVTTISVHVNDENSKQ